MGQIFSSIIHPVKSLKDYFIQRSLMYIIEAELKERWKVPFPEVSDLEVKLNVTGGVIDQCNVALVSAG